jgi:hypothetical protein
MVDEQFITDFKKVTKYNLADLLANYSIFIQQDFPLLVDYINGLNADIREPYTRLKNLADNYKKVINLFSTHKKRFKNTLLNFISYAFIEEQYYLNIKFIENIDKYNRSSISLNGFNKNTQRQYIKRQNQTLENISKTELQDADPQTDWTNIALQNDLLETDYDVLKTKELSISTTNQSIGKVKLDSVVDLMDGEKLLGLDFNKKINFVNDDFEILPYNETFKQAVEIGISIESGDVPEIPEVGFQNDFLIGGNLGLLQNSVLIRNFDEIFSLDDTVIEQRILESSLEEETRIIRFYVRSVYDAVYFGEKELKL